MFLKHIDYFLSRISSHRIVAGQIDGNEPVYVKELSRVDVSV